MHFLTRAENQTAEVFGFEAPHALTDKQTNKKASFTQADQILLSLTAFRYHNVEFSVSGA